MKTPTPTPLGVMVLALLREGDMHPYEMLRLLRHRRGDRMVRLTNGTLYHTVARLQKDGLIAEVGVDREGNRPERTTYTLVGDGREVLETWVRRGLSLVDREAEFQVALAEAHNLPRAEVVGLVSARRALLAEQLDALGSGLADARARSVSAQFLLEHDRQVALLDADLAWTDGFLADLADPAFVWGVCSDPDGSDPDSSITSSGITSSDTTNVDITNSDITDDALRKAPRE
ncbi:DNA-binding PadR family transcriptional regulator [Microbacterium resistens]|uniref:DNA-binding PadR family transcriptional regulator n=1 Tax=Microbacterium resistens TaxID=156977 RepID=A0ABU1SA51_9MICO|nr:PadR family transcriptional regulator [Microbacterium resistens]MDR6866486.1 DNA-binding PadR family transcriptional regulator [Microbacterium resistens]